MIFSRRFPPSATQRDLDDVAAVILEHLMRNLAEGKQRDALHIYLDLR